MPNNDNELNHLIWYFSLTKKEKDLLNTLPNNIKGGLDWLSIRGASALLVAAPVEKISQAKELVKPVAKRGRKKGTKAVGKAPVAIVKNDGEKPVKKTRGRPKK